MACETDMLHPDWLILGLFNDTTTCRVCKMTISKTAWKKTDDSCVVSQDNSQYVRSWCIDQKPRHSVESVKVSVAEVSCAL
jgi:hypothetical protein